MSTHATANKATFLSRLGGIFNTSLQSLAPVWLETQNAKLVANARKSNPAFQLSEEARIAAGLPKRTFGAISKTALLNLLDFSSGVKIENIALLGVVGLGIWFAIRKFT